LPDSRCTWKLKPRPVAAVASMQPKDAAEDIVIAGAGLAGLAAALGLHRYADALGCGLATCPVHTCQPIARRKLDLRRRTRNLCRKGVRSLVLESSPSLRASGFAFTTWKNAFRALDALGVGDKIREQHLQARALRVVASATREIVGEADFTKQGKR